jgi:branched-subunit amino acid ABC-type transport system permease component
MRFSPQVGINMVIGVVVLAALSTVLYLTPFGRSMRACSVNPMGASLAGIPVRRIWAATYIMGGLLSGVAGVLILYTTGMDYSLSLNLTLSGFGAAILFGLTSPSRAFLGGLAMGLVQALSTAYVPGAWATAVPFAFIFLMLSFGRMNRAVIAGGRA